MSALTDLFTAMANKIRSKTGGSDTYTPAEMVSDGIDDVYDAGVAAGTTPTQTKSVTAGTSQVTVTPDTGYALSSVTVDPTPSETKTEGPNVSTNKEVTPTSGKLLSKVTITPLTHTGTYTPAANTAANDMGAYHDKRYVNTSGMIVPSGAKSITANGTGIDVSGYATANVNVPNPTLSGDAATGNVLSGKTFYNTTYTKQTGSMTDRTGWTSTGNNCNASTTKDVTIPAGYHDGSGYVRFNSLSSQTAPASGKTAVDASHMHSGYSGWVNGAQVNGTYTAPTISNITPADSNPPALTSGSNYKMLNNGYAVHSPLMSITPSSTPASLGTSYVYKFSSTAYVVDGYTNVTPSANGTAFDAGMRKMASGGYAYSAKPTSFDETTLWTNSAPTSAFPQTTVTLSQSIENFKFIQIKYVSNGSAQDILLSPILSVSDLQKSTDVITSYQPMMTIAGVNKAADTTYVRRVTWVSNTQIKFSNAFKMNAAANSSAVAIPIQIFGLKFK